MRNISEDWGENNDSLIPVKLMLLFQWSINFKHSAINSSYNFFLDDGIYDSVRIWLYNAMKA